MKKRKLADELIALKLRFNQHERTPVGEGAHPRGSKDTALIDQLVDARVRDLMKPYEEKMRALGESLEQLVKPTKKIEIP